MLKYHHLKEQYQLCFKLFQLSFQHKIMLYIFNIEYIYLNYGFGRHFYLNQLTSTQEINFYQRLHSLETEPMTLASLTLRSASSRYRNTTLNPQYKNTYSWYALRLLFQIFDRFTYLGRITFFHSCYDFFNDLMFYFSEMPTQYSDSSNSKKNVMFLKKCIEKPITISLWIWYDAYLRFQHQ